MISMTFITFYYIIINDNNTYTKVITFGFIVTFQISLKLSNVKIWNTFNFEIYLLCTNVLYDIHLLKILKKI